MIQAANFREHIASFNKKCPECTHVWPAHRCETPSPRLWSDPVLVIAVSLIGNQRVGFIDRTLTDVGDGAAVKQRYAINFRGSVHDRAIAIRDAVLVENDRDLQRHLADIERLKEFYRDSAGPMDAMFRKEGATTREKQLLAAIKR